MTSAELRIKVATVCGWTFQKGTKPRYGGTNFTSGWVHPDKTRLFLRPPDFPTDLNACRDAWEHNAPVEYWNELYDSIPERHNSYVQSLIAVCKATAEQRCHARLICEEKGIKWPMKGEN